MPPTTAADEFVRSVRELGLVPASRAAEFDRLTVGTTDPRRLPRDLLTADFLTEHQAKTILAGKADELRIGRYVVARELGGGGMGRVVQAYDPQMERWAAVKTVRPDSPELAARFEQEIRAAARLAHPNIVRAYDVVPVAGGWALVTEFIDGYDLSAALRARGPLSAADACALVAQAAEGLQHAHENGLIHRDIKPANLLVSAADGVLKVADFGIARFAEAATAGGLTGRGGMIGTPAYMAPEQANDSTRVDIRADLYSLGCTLYHLLAGQPPFAGGVMDLLRQHQTDPPPPLADVCPGLSPALVGVVDKLMAKNPADRYQTPREAAAALARFVPRTRDHTTVNRPLADTAGGSGLATRPYTPPAAPTTLPPTELKPAVKRRRWPLLAAGAVLGLLATAAAVFFLWPRSNTVTVQISIPVEELPRAKEAGVTLFLDDKPVTLDDLRKPMALTEGRHTLVVKKDGQAVEWRKFLVTPAVANAAVTLLPAVAPDPDADTGELHRTRAAGVVTDVRFSADGQRYVIAACPNDPWRFSLKDAKCYFSVHTLTGEVLDTWEEHRGFRAAILPAPDRVVYFAVNSRLGGPITNRPQLLLQIPDPTARRLPRTVVVGTDMVDTQRVTSVDVSPDCQRFLWGTAKYDSSKTPIGDLRLHSTGGKPEAQFELKELNRFAGDVGCFDPSGKRIFTARDKTPTLWAEDTGKTIKTFSPAAARISCVAVSSDGKLAAGGCEDGTLVVWDVTTREITALGKGHTGTVNAVAFIPDRDRVATAGDDGSVRYWDATSGKELRKFDHDGPVLALSASPGGKRLLSGSADKTVRLWQLPAD